LVVGAPFMFSALNASRNGRRCSGWLSERQIDEWDVGDVAVERINLGGKVEREPL
jgi:hypothetical protein